jgi:hypothetical protein
MIFLHVVGQSILQLINDDLFIHSGYWPAPPVRTKAEHGTKKNYETHTPPLFAAYFKRECGFPEMKRIV